MSRVSYPDTPARADQEALRAAHNVRLVTEVEEGTGLDALPGGVYGFTYSPGLPNAPLFATRRFRNDETHKLRDGEVLIVGFVTADAARQCSSTRAGVSVQVRPEPDDEADTLVTIPYSRIRQHRQYAAPNQHGFSVTVIPDTQREKWKSGRSNFEVVLATYNLLFHFSPCLSRLNRAAQIARPLGP